jgi:molecular chaperone DnaJ
MNPASQDGRSTLDLMAADFYDLLGVSRSATAEELKRAYRRRARELHPDANPGDAAAEARFKELSRAYETLRDPQLRQRYDTYGEAGVGAAGGRGDPFGGGGIGDIFDAFFSGQSPFGGGAGGQSGPPRGADLEAVLRLDFEQAVFGAEEDVVVKTAVVCERCEATGAEPGTTPHRCGECGGSGQVRRMRQSILGQMVTAGPCPTCNGVGEIIADRCRECGGEGRRVEEKTFVVDVPPGVDNGSTLRLTGRGAVGPRGGGIGDLYVHIEVRLHDRFVRDGDDLRHELSISPTQAVLGTEHVLDTLDGPETIEIRAGTPTGHVLRFRGRGVPRLQHRGRGDLLVEVVVAVPDDLSEEEEELWRRLAELRGDEVAPPGSGLMGRIRSALK